VGKYSDFEGNLDAEGMRISIVAGRFNDHVTKPLLEGALGALDDLGCDGVPVYWVPGAFEIPLVAQRLALSHRFDAVICLGAVIRGATAHFDHVAGQAASGIARAGLDTGVPVIFGVLTTDTIEQAMERVGAKGTNRGADAAFAALEMASLLRQLKAPAGTTGARGEPPAR